MAGLEGMIGPALMAGGTAMSVTGYLDASRATNLQAQRRQQAAEFAALQLEQQAGQETAAGQFAAEEQRRQGRIAGSNILARAAASGGSASDPTIINLIARSSGEASYRAALASYQGNAAARHLRLQAAGQRYGADLTRADAGAASSAYKQRALTTALTGAGTMYDRFWSQPKTDGWTSGYDLPMGN